MRACGTHSTMPCLSSCSVYSDQIDRGMEKLDRRCPEHSECSERVNSSRAPADGSRLIEPIEWSEAAN